MLGAFIGSSGIYCLQLWRVLPVATANVPPALVNSFKAYLLIVEICDLELINVPSISLIKKTLLKSVIIITSKWS